MLNIFTDEALSLHKEYLRQARLRYAILEDGIKSIKNKNYNDILRQKMNKRDKEDVLKELSNIALHNVFFGSFGQNEYPKSSAAVLCFGNEAALLNKIYELAVKLDFGFVCVYCENKKIEVYGSQDRVRLLSYGMPRLAVDVCEHAYFLDYGFDKSRYLLRALPYLKLNELNW